MLLVCCGIVIDEESLKVWICVLKISMAFSVCSTRWSLVKYPLWLAPALNRTQLSLFCSVSFATE